MNGRIQGITNSKSRWVGLQSNYLRSTTINKEIEYVRYEKHAMEAKEKTNLKNLKEIIEVKMQWRGKYSADRVNQRLEEVRTSEMGRSPKVKWEKKLWEWKNNYKLKDTDKASPGSRETGSAATGIYK